jgi:hypothetical protein
MENFKLSFTDSTTFAGKDLEGFYAAALLKGTSKESFKLIPDVKSTAKLGLLDVGNILQDADCTFTSGGEGTLSQKTVIAHPFKVNLEYCQRTFERDYLSLALRAGSNSDASIRDVYCILIENNIVKKEELPVLEEWLVVVRQK